MTNQSDRRDKFTYTSPDQIRIGGSKDRSRERDWSRELRDFIEDHNLDPLRVLHHLRDHLDDLKGPEVIEE